MWLTEFENTLNRNHNLIYLFIRNDSFYIIELQNK